MPGVIVAQPAAQRGPDDRRHHHGDAIKREGLPAFGGRKRRSEDRLRHRRHAAAREPLQHTKEEKRIEIPGDAAAHGANREQDQAGDEEIAAAEGLGDPARRAKDDGIGDEIGRHHPGRLIGPHRKAARDVAQRDIRDGGVEHLHERRDRDHDGDHPRVDALELAFLFLACSSLCVAHGLPLLTPAPMNGDSRGSRAVCPFVQQCSVDMHNTCTHVARMPTMIQIRNVPDDIHRTLKSRAALAGMSLSEYLLKQLDLLVQQPTMSEYRAQLRRHRGPLLDVSIVDDLREEREKR